MQNSERDRANLQRHMREAEARAAIGGHQLSAWERAKPGLFTWEAVCTRCGEKVQAGAMTPGSYRLNLIASDVWGNASLLPLDVRVGSGEAKAGHPRRRSRGDWIREAVAADRAGRLHWATKAHRTPLMSRSRNAAHDLALLVSNARVSSTPSLTNNGRR